jgi:hypothetical protein
MKKIISIIFCSAIISGAFAQNDNGDFYEKNSNGYYIDHPNDHDYNYYSGSYRNDRANKNQVFFQREEEIQKVNDENNYQVQLVLNDYDNLTIWEKRDLLNNLESQRIQKINSIYFRYKNTIAYSSHIDSNLFQNDRRRNMDNGTNRR